MKKGIILLLMIGIGLAIYWQHYHPSPAHTHLVHSHGRLEFVRFDVASLHAGKIDNLPVHEGEYVEQHAILAHLSDNHIQAQVDAAHAGVRQAQFAVKRAEAQFLAQQQHVHTAQLEVKNAHHLFQQRLISSAELSKRLAQQAAAEATLTAIQASIEEAQARVTQANAQLTQAQNKQEEFIIKAPKAGRVVYRLVEEGNVVAAGQYIVSLLDVTDASMSLFFPAPLVNQMQLNSDARLLFDGVNAVFPAKLTYIASEAQFTPKFVETDNEREKLMFKVKLQIPKQVASHYVNYLKAGMTGKGFIRLDSHKEWPAELQISLPK